MSDKASKLLINESPLQVLPSLARLIGLNEALFLQQLHYWISNPKVGVEHSGRKWVRNTFQEWVDDNFPFWSLNTLKRTVEKLREENLLLVTKTLNKARYDKTLWYSIDYHKLNLLLDPKPKMGLGSAHRPKAQNGLIDQPKMGSPIPETTQREEQKIAPNGAQAKPEKRGDILDGMIYYAQKAEGKPDVGFLQEHLRPLALAFCEEAGQGHYPIRSDHSLWRKTFAEFYDRGFKAEHVREATRLHVKDGLATKGPLSIEYKLKDLANTKKASTPQFREVHQ